MLPMNLEKRTVSLIRPHPSPLPRGEGVPRRPPRVDSKRSRLRAVRSCEERTTALPLPRGEGWGEGGRNHSTLPEHKLLVIGSGNSRFSPERGCVVPTSRSMPPHSTRRFCASPRCGWCSAHRRAPQNENCCIGSGARAQSPRAAVLILATGAVRPPYGVPALAGFHAPTG